MRRKRHFTLYSLTTIVYTFSMGDALGQGDLELRYHEPATVWEECLPLGNGRLGMTPSGDPFSEDIVLNDITLWSGTKQDANNYDAHKSLPRIRELILQGKNDQAQDLVNSNFVCLGPGSGGAKWGKFQTMGKLNIAFDYGPENSGHKYKNYLRTLNLHEAIAHTSYTLGNTHFQKEYFSSFDDDVQIIKLTADRAGKLNFKIALDRQERFENNLVDGDLEMSGQLDNGIDGQGMRYAARVRVIPKGGTLLSNKDSIVVKGASEATIYIAAGTDFRAADFKTIMKQELNRAVKKAYKVQRDNHINHYSGLFSRVKFDLGSGKEKEWTTKQRLDNFYSNPSDDVSLPALFFQYARYLSISSTRPGLLPPNLQGLWAHEINTPWNGDYHLDVNVQMNHWALGVGNLAELNLPLAELVKGLVIPGQRTAKAYYDANGWIAHVITNVWGFTEPGESANWGASNAGSGWLCNNLWSHYEYTLDEEYLRDIYPVLKGSAEFYNDALIKEPNNGWLVTSPSVSPENSFYLPNGNQASISMGPTIDNQIVRELFTNVITAANKLGVDKKFTAVLASKLKQLPPPGIISKDGRIQEWLEDYKEVDPQHRHISHLYGLYPASLITPNKTPALAEAAKKSLEVRGDDGPSWAIAYKQLFWARLLDGDRAFKLLKEILKPTTRTDINYGAGGGVYYNLLSAGPPFQIDGNFGASAGIAEMVLQSHDDYIHLLPAIPEAWKSYGSVKGLKAKGNITVDMTWRNGQVTNFKLFSPEKNTLTVKVNNTLKSVQSEKI
ncbi:MULTISPECIES: glycoside hydrolase family 95 protein [Sphingobacterium]|uniref:Glycoside hydrolase N-terminal domain-containing protein n=1 Tax=Sphingobacterium populi TaxID=1812824 RepID=A0ABW5UDR8_9SPHI|nr:glycoside hydrolase family 95 protein [Sphingobacterium sp. CFCC 11742]